jgi:diguanylate cyclase (GGDEF)-like protein/PAS domain S-box-containing protein
MYISRKEVGEVDMYNELEKRYRSRANKVILFCALFFGSFRVLAEIMENNFRSAGICAIISAIAIVLFIFSWKKNIKNFSLIVSSLLYIVYVGASFTIGSFKYFYDYYLLTLLICAVYFNTGNFLILLVATQIVNIFLSVFVLPSHTVGNVWVHFSLTFSSSLLLFIAVQFAVSKSNEVNNAFTSFGALMNITPNVLILIDENNRIKYLSRSVYKVLGIREPENYVGKNFLDLFMEDPVKELFSEVAKKRVFFENYQKISIGGRVKTFDVFADKMSDNMADGMFFMFNDISEIIRLKEMAEQDSIMDGLIQIPNRRAFNKQIVNEWNRALRDKVNLSFLMIDIDFFKKYNDTYGHSQGDELLKIAGEVFKNSLKRSTDFVARLGGEEFGVLLHATNSFQASVTAERIRKAVEDEVIVTRSGEQTRFTVSIGVCTLIPRVGLEYNVIVEEADKALYKAKENGRNQVQVVDWV